MNPLIGAARVPQMMQQLQQLKANPGAFLRNMGYNVPDNILNNPTGIMQHLAQSGQLNQNQIMQYNQAMQQQRQVQNGPGPGTQNH